MAKICTWNVNGIRSRKNLGEVFEEIHADVFCIQETKIQKDQIEENIAFVNNEYSSCFAIPKLASFKKGRSGCVTYYLDSSRPYHAEFGLLDDQYSSDDWKTHLKTLGDSVDDIVNLDGEGRLVITCHDIKITTEDCDETRNLIIFNVYFPRLDPDRADRVQFKANFNKLIEHKTKHYLKDPKSHVIIACDLNIQHKQIDSFEIEEDFDNNQYREWFTEFLKPTLDASERYMIDSFRMLHESRKNAFTCWPTLIPGSRENNFGYRIDLMIIDSELAKYTKDVKHLTQVKGSDHCPVLLELKNIKFVGSKYHPAGSSRTWHEFRKRQTSLTSFFTVTQRPKPEQRDDIDYGPEALEVNKKLKLSPGIISQASNTQSASSFSQKSTQPVITHGDDSNKPLTAYEKIMQKKQPNQNKPRHCPDHGLVCVPKTNNNKKSPNYKRNYLSCPNPHCKYFRWVSRS